MEQNRRRMNKRKLGSDFEKKATDLLKEHNYEILELNFRSRYGEIDIVAKDGEYICFVEVKFRSAYNCGYAAEAVDRRKRHIICQVANYYMMKNGISEWTPCRFDVVAFDGSQVQLIQNAWEI